MHEKDELLQGGPGRNAEPFMKAFRFFRSITNVIEKYIF
jgi:hypothetical protein